MKIKEWTSSNLKETKECFLCKAEKQKDELREIYRDDKCIVILDAFPPTKGYTLVALRKHKEDISELSEEEYLEISKLVHKIAKKIQKAFKPKRIVLLQSGTFAQHFHFHIIPMYEDLYNNLLDVITKKKIIEFSDAEWKEIKEKIQKA